MAAISDDLPALGKPTRPMSATALSSSTSSRSSPGSPLSAKPGALRGADARAALPRPPRPPAAAMNWVPVPTRSATMSPSLVRTTVPVGTLMIRSSPAAPLRFEPSPWRPLSAFLTGRRWKSSSVELDASTSRITLPPRPPLPPSGPPSGLNFSRWTDAQPFPPWPACTRSDAWSANSAMLIPFYMRMAGQETGPPRTFSFCFGLLGHVFNVQRVRVRDDAHGAATAVPSELDLAGHQREQRVVVTATDALARVEVRAALPDDDLARVDELAAQALHAKPLRVRVTAVTAGRRALLVCHFCCPLRLLRSLTPWPWPWRCR